MIRTKENGKRKSRAEVERKFIEAKLRRKVLFFCVGFVRRKILHLLSLRPFVSQKPFFSTTSPFAFFNFSFIWSNFVLSFYEFFFSFAASHAGDMFAIVCSCYEQRKKVEISSHTTSSFSVFIYGKNEKCTHWRKKMEKFHPISSPIPRSLLSHSLSHSSFCRFVMKNKKKSISNI